ncbi:hypothetical protein TIFTF001_031114 [Ficus carica]|uniref:Uncharacterized protein n=1 Tax=Ficus carica TaxID=3494 RepID=A0AA88J4P8_FICCA|nr:hypothetical protein TIFTF001_031114 [Ficus carica]
MTELFSGQSPVSRQIPGRFAAEAHRMALPGAQPTTLPPLLPFSPFRRGLNASPVKAIRPAAVFLFKRSRGRLDLEGSASRVHRRSWIARGEEKSAATEPGLHASPSQQSISSESRRQLYSRAKEPELQRTEQGDLFDLAGGERNSAGRSELVAEDRASSSEEERNGLREEREKGVFGKMKFD